MLERPQVSIIYVLSKNKKKNPIISSPEPKAHWWAYSIWRYPSSVRRPSVYVLSKTKNKNPIIWTENCHFNSNQTSQYIARACSCNESTVLYNKRLTNVYCVYRWMWSEAVAQPKLEQGLEIGGFGYPVSLTVKFLNFQTPKNLCCKLPTIRTKRPKLRLFGQNGAKGKANSKDHDQTAPIWVCSVCLDPPVRKLRVIR